MAEDELIFEPASVLNLPPVDTERMQPHALDRYIGFLKELYKEVPLDQLTDEDLTHDEKAERKQHTDKIAEWVQNCDKDGDEAALRVYPYSTAVINYMDGLKALLETVHRRKVRLGALKAIGPPFQDARKFLSEGEYDSFLGTLAGATDGYLTKGRGCLYGDWRLHEKAIRYAVFVKMIEERKEEESRQKQALLEHEQFIKEINDSVKKMKKQLAKEKKPSFHYPPALADYHPDAWYKPKLPTKQEVEKWAQQYIWERVPQALRNFTSWEVTWKVLRLPYAEYEVLGVPCVTWCFRTLILAEVHLRLAEGEFTKTFQGYSYKIKVDAEGLGTLCLGPAEWDHREGFSTPLALLALLTKGENEGDGIKVARVDGSTTSFVVRGYYEDSIELDDGFRKFIMEMGKEDLPQALLKMDLVDETTAALAKAHWGDPLPPAANKGEHWGPSGLEAVVTKLVEMGWPEHKALEAAKSVSFPAGATVDDTVKYLIQNPYAKP